MKTTRMTVEGTKGWANIAYRDVAGKQVIGIRGDGAAGVFDLNVDTRDERSQRYAAARLQRELDGYRKYLGILAEDTDVPARPARREERFDEALRRVQERFGGDLRRLAEGDEGK